MMRPLALALARSMTRIAADLLPARHADWGAAMRAEAAAIERGRAALAFAFGCLAAAIHLSIQIPSPETMKPMSPRLLDRPRSVAMLCGAGAVALGLAYMVTAGAPPRLLAMNGAALAIGFVLVQLLTRTGGPTATMNALLAALALLATAAFGVSAEGVTRWVMVGGILLQPGMLLVPALCLAVAHRPNEASCVAVMIAAIALAMQPDRALAGALAAAMTLLAVIRPRPAMAVAALAALAGFVLTQIQADPSPAMPYVDQILFSAFAAHPLAGVAVWAGSALLLAPAIVGMMRDPDHRAVYAVFGLVWLAIIVAAAFANFPTPLVGYGGSAILGYMVSLLGLPVRTGPVPVSASPDAPATGQLDRPDNRRMLANC